MSKLLLKEFGAFYEDNRRDGFQKFLYHLLNEQLDGIDLGNKKILDVGCGDGMISAFVALYYDNCNVIALDEDEGRGAVKGSLSTIEKAKCKFNLRNVDVIRSDFLRTEFSNDSFDVLIGNYSFHHIVEENEGPSRSIEVKEKWNNLFSEVYRILKPGGCCILREITGFNFWNHSKCRLGFSYIDWNIHPTSKEFVGMFTAAGFRNVRYSFSVNYRLRHFKKVLMNNPIYGYFINPNFHICGSK